MTSFDFAKYVDMDHTSALKLIKKYKNELANFGEVKLKEIKHGPEGGRPGQHFDINEYQFLMLVMLCRNTKASIIKKMEVVRGIEEDERGPK